MFAHATNTTAQAAGVCAKREDLVKALANQYQETRKSVGVTANVNFVEIFSSKSGTWTIIVTRPTGLSCIIATGDGWDDSDATKKDTDL